VIADLNEVTGKCDVCRTDNDWKLNMNTGKCECSDFANILDRNLCQTCQELIPGCKQCEQTDDPGDSLAVKIGYDQRLSPRRGEWVKCVDCGPNMVYLKEQNECRSCD